MKLIKRNNCPITNDDKLELLFSFKKFPLYMGCVETDKNKDVLVDMNWYIGERNGIIQLNPLIPLEALYEKSHGSGTIGKLWNLHHENFAEFISKYKLKNLLEIGSGHGQLIQNYFNFFPECHWTVVEPNPIIKNDSRIKVYKALFDKNFEINSNIDGVIHSHVIEHLYDPVALLKNINEKIKIGTLHIFSVPNLKIMLEKKYTNALNFEHTLFLEESVIDEILKITGFQIIEKKYFMEDHSIFYATRKIKGKKRKIEIDNYKKNKKLYNNYTSFHLKLVKELNDKILNISNNIYLFGAHVFSQYLINFGLKEEKIKFILDNDKEKQNKRLYGTNLKVISPKILAEEPCATVILRSGVYNQEIKDDILSNINKNVIFLE
jgi:hypothetical protein